MTHPPARRDRHELEVLGAFVHGVLTAFHGLGLLYNARQGNNVDCAMHAGALVYDAWAMRKHWRAAR